MTVNVINPDASVLTQAQEHLSVNPPKVLAVVSDSSGKDSGLTIELAIEALGRENVRIAFADTGNEHDLVYQHLDYQRERYGEIVTVKADFTDRIARKRDYVLNVWPTKGVPEQIVQQALSVLQPTGVPFLDLCLWKGRFPSRMAQFCTQELKRIPLDNFMLDLLSRGFKLESWRGIRRDESQNRRDAKAREATPEGWTVVHPIVDFTAQQVIDEHARRGLKLNPLYSLGASRVGCMPCINENKDGLLNISKRFPGHLDKVREWERLVSLASKRGWTTFFTECAIESRVARLGWMHERRALLGDNGEPVSYYNVWIEPDESIHARCNIDRRISWAQTSRGGRQTDFIRLEPVHGCSSLYGLCE